MGRLSNRIGSCFGWTETRRRARVYLEVLLSNVPRKNGWQLAEHAGDATPKNIQHFPGRAKWNADDVRDDLQQYVVRQLAQRDGVLIVDETGFLKKGIKWVGSIQVRPDALKIVRSKSFLRIAPPKDTL